MFWFGRDLKDHLVSPPCHGQGYGNMLTAFCKELLELLVKLLFLLAFTCCCVQEGHSTTDWI